MPKAIASYNAVAKGLHWLIAAAIVGMLALGWIMTDLPKGDPLQFPLFQWHKSIGITILLLSLVRLGWRLVHPAPPLPKGMPHWESLAARATHILFYVAMIGMPFAGWVMVSTSSLNLPTMLYGLVEWPNLPILPTLENKKQIGHLFSDLHSLGAYALAALLVLHIGAAWKHHLIDRDDVLLRMAPKFLTRTLNCVRGQK
jgi:cytochrome b561